jgi:transcription antitermination factor NusG
MGTQATVDSQWVAPALTISAWFAVHTASRHEKQVALQLEGRRIEHFLPTYEETHRWADRRVRVEMPLFPGYLFVRIAAGQRMDVLQVPGVARMIGFGGAPVPVAEAEIEALRKSIVGGMRLEPHPYLKVGRRVRVRNGVLSGVEGILQRKKEGDRIVISVDLIMRSVSMEIDAADVEVI